MIPMDIGRADSPTRIYGRININTATKEVLERLPFDLNITITGVTTQPTLTATEAAEYIVAYRDKTDDIPGILYDTDGRISTSDITGLSETKGFMAVGEVAIPLIDYLNKAYLDANSSLTPEQLEQRADYLDARNKLYSSISNLISVNSDTYVVNIAIELREPGGTTAIQTWYYVAVIDRSNCVAADDTPAVLLFSQVSSD